MGDYRTNLAISFIMAPFFIVLGALPFVSRQYKVFGRVGIWSGLVAAAMVRYVCALVAFTLFPMPAVGDPAAFCLAHAGVARPQLTLFASLDDSWQGVPGAFWQVFFNFLLFVPLGFFLRYRYRRGPVCTVLAGFAVSLTIEFTQLTGDWGLYPCPYRLFDVDDLVTNTVGTVIGWAAAVLLRRTLPSAWPRPRPDEEPPGLVRRIVGDLLDFGIWWLAAAAISIVAEVTLEQGVLVFLLAVAHLIVVLAREDRRSLAGLAAGTTATTRAVALNDPPDALEFPERWRARL